MLEENEYGCIGTGIGSGIDNTNELKVLGLNLAMASPNKNEWQALVNCEHGRMLKNGVWEVVDHNNVPEGCDIIDSTWAMKKKANGNYRACLAARGFKQMQGNSFVHHNISSLVMHGITMSIILVFMPKGKLSAHLVNVNGAFLLGEFKPREKIDMKIPWGFEKFYPHGGLLFLKRTLYGVKNAAKAFWRLVIGIMNKCGYK